MQEAGQRGSRNDAGAAPRSEPPRHQQTAWLSQLPPWGQAPPRGVRPRLAGPDPSVGTPLYAASGTRPCRRTDLGGAVEARDALDVRRVREEVERPQARERVATLREDGRVACQRRRVAGDVDDAAGAQLGHAARGLGGHARSGRVEDDHVGRGQALRDQVARRLAGIGSHELDVGDAVGERVLARPLDRLGDDLDADHAARGTCEGKADRARPAVQVPDDLAAGQRGLLDRVLIEHVGHLGVRLQERAGRDAQAQAADLLLEPGAAEQRPRRDAAGHLGHAVVDRVEHSDDARGALLEQRLEILDAGQLATGGDEDAEQLARAHALAHDQVPEEAGVGALVVGLEALGACPIAERLAHGVAGVARQQADLDGDDLLPAARLVEAERDALGRARPGVLQLVAIGVLAHGRHDRLDRRLRQPGDALQRVEHLLLLVLELALVAQVLPAATATGAEVRAGRLDTVGPARQALERDRLAVAALDALDPRHHAVARKRAIDEHDDAVMARDATPTRCQRVDGELELLSDPKRRSHGGSIGGGPLSGSGSRSAKARRRRVASTPRPDAAAAASQRLR